MTNVLTVQMTRREQLFGTIYLLLTLSLLPFIFPICLSLLFPNLSSVAQNFIYFLFNFLCIGLLLRKFLWASLDQLGAHPIRLLLTVLLGLFAYFLLNHQVSILLLLFAPDFFNVNDNQIADLATQNFTLMAAGSVLLVPMAEECLYRGVVFGGLLKKNTLLAYTVSILLFSFVHIVPYFGIYHIGTLLLCMLQYLPAGFCLAWVYQKSDSIFAPILLHTVVNAIGMFSVR